MKITAYANKMSAAPGETIDFMVNCENKSFDVEFVKLICGDLNPEGPGYKEKVVKSRTSGKYKGCLLYTSPSPRDRTRSRMPSSA